MKKHWWIAGLLLAAVGTGIAMMQEPEDETAELLQSGPMLGYAEMREVLLWAQTNQAAEVFFGYREQGTNAPYRYTQPVQTQKATAYVAKCIADDVEPSKTYEYALFINKTRLELERKTTFQTLPLWHFRTDPPTFDVALGSCFYVNEEAYDRPGKPYGGGYSIVEDIADKAPEVMLWLGDNTYFRPADWNTWTGMLHRHTHTRSLPQLQNLLSSTHHYAIWDDHDYGPNDHNRSFIHKQKALEAFELFWGNPTTGFMDEACATTQFDWGDAQFILLDNRWFRIANNTKAEGEEPYFGKKQIDWLIDALKASEAHFKIVASGGQIINPAKVWENYANYEAERAYLFKRLLDEKIDGVVFLSGDRHHAELSMMEREGAYPLYDFTTSPLTSGTHQLQDEGNAFQVEGSLYGERNFGMLHFEGPYKKRVMTMQLYNAKGKLEWERKVAASDLMFNE